MKKIIFCMFVASVLVACSDSGDLMKCGDFEVSTEIVDETLVAIINGDRAELAQTVSASGARYEGVLNDTLVVL